MSCGIVKTDNIISVNKPDSSKAVIFVRLIIVVTVNKERLKENLNEVELSAIISMHPHKSTPSLPHLTITIQ